MNILFKEYTKGKFTILERRIIVDYINLVIIAIVIYFKVNPLDSFLLSLSPLVFSILAFLGIILVILIIFYWTSALEYSRLIAEYKKKYKNYSKEGNVFSFKNPRKHKFSN